MGGWRYRRIAGSTETICPRTRLFLCVAHGAGSSFQILTLGQIAADPTFERDPLYLSRPRHLWYRLIPVTQRAIDAIETRFAAPMREAADQLESTAKFVATGAFRSLGINPPENQTGLSG